MAASLTYRLAGAIDRMARIERPTVEADRVVVAAMLEAFLPALVNACPKNDTLRVIDDGTLWERCWWRLRWFIERG